MPIRHFPDCQRPIYDIAGLPFDAISLQQAMQKVLRSTETRESLFIFTPNLNFLITAQKDAAFRETIYHSDMCLADGMPIVWLARLKGVPIPQRVSGSDLFEALCKQTEKTIQVFFFGGPDGAARQATERINRVAEQRRLANQTPDIFCVGYESPGFGSVEDMSKPEVIQPRNGFWVESLERHCRIALEGIRHRSPEVQRMVGIGKGVLSIRAGAPHSWPISGPSD